MARGNGQLTLRDARVLPRNDPYLYGPGWCKQILGAQQPLRTISPDHELLSRVTIEEDIGVRLNPSFFSAYENQRSRAAAVGAYFNDLVQASSPR